MDRKIFATAAVALALALGVSAGAAAQEAMVVAPNGDVGVGISAPAEKFHVFEDVDANSLLVIENPNPGIAAAGALRARSDAALVNLIAHGSGRTLTRFGRTLGGWAEMLQVSGNGLIVGTSQDRPLVLGTNAASRLTITGSGSVGVGTSSPASRFHVTGGDVRVTGGSFIDDGVTLNAPDYVFEPGYDLKPLAEVKAFIARERHLPNVPSAAEIKAGGLRLGQFQMLLLEKIEELTLHAISQEEEIQRLRAENAELAEGLGAELRARLAALEQAVGVPAAAETPAARP